MKIFKSSEVFLNSSTKIYLLAQALLISFVTFILGYTAAFEMDNFDYFVPGWALMFMALVNLIGSFIALEFGDNANK